MPPSGYTGEILIRERIPGAGFLLTLDVRRRNVGLSFLERAQFS